MTLTKRYREYRGATDWRGCIGIVSGQPGFTGSMVETGKLSREAGVSVEGLLMRVQRASEGLDTAARLRLMALCG